MWKALKIWFDIFHRHYFHIVLFLLQPGIEMSSRQLLDIFICSRRYPSCIQCLVWDKCSMSWGYPDVRFFNVSLSGDLGLSISCRLWTYFFKTIISFYFHSLVKFEQFQMIDIKWIYFDLFLLRESRMCHHCIIFLASFFQSLNFLRLLAVLNISERVQTDLSSFYGCISLRFLVAERTNC